MLQHVALMAGSPFFVVFAFISVAFSLQTALLPLRKLIFLPYSSFVCSVNSHFIDIFRSKLLQCMYSMSTPGGLGFFVFFCFAFFLFR